MDEKKEKVINLFQNKINSIRWTLSCYMLFDISNVNDKK